MFVEGFNIYITPPSILGRCNRYVKPNKKGEFKASKEVLDLWKDKEKGSYLDYIMCHGCWNTGIVGPCSKYRLLRGKATGAPCQAW